jgi:hypothetical protein
VTESDAREWWEERAAIMEHDGEKTQETADLLAGRQLALLVGRSRARRWLSSWGQP